MSVVHGENLSPFHADRSTEASIPYSTCFTIFSRHSAFPWERFTHPALKLPRANAAEAWAR